MFIWRKITAEQWLLNVSAQMAGGVLAFPIVQGVSRMYGVTIGGPELKADEDIFEAGMNECISSFILLMGIFMFCCTKIGTIYCLKQPLVAAVIRYCCYYYGRTGPAMNPMLATTWAFFVAGRVWPNDSAHYIVYWFGSIAGAVIAAITWSTLDPSGPSGFFAAKNKVKVS